MYIPQYCAEIESKLGDQMDLVLKEAVMSCGHPRDFLTTYFFEGLLVMKQEVLDNDPDLKLKVFIVLLDFLYQTGYVKQKPELFRFIDNPVIPIDELLDMAIGTRMPVWKSDVLAGEKATLAILSRFFPEVIRRTAVIVNERGRMYERFRAHLGNIGFKLLTTSSSTLSQMERTQLAIYSIVKEGYPMWPQKKDASLDLRLLKPITPVETKDPLVLEVGNLITSLGMPGPCLNYRKLVSNGNFETLILYWGPHVAELKTYLGYKRSYGKFVMYKTDPEDSLPWTLKDQITGITAKTLNIFYKPAAENSWSARTPTIIADEELLVPDMPDLNLYPVYGEGGFEEDISQFWWDYFSEWRGRRISELQGADLKYYLCDYALKNKEAGGMPVEMDTIPSDTLLYLVPGLGSAAFESATNKEIWEWFILPSPAGLVKKRADMRAFYARFGNIELKPAFADRMELPPSWFMAKNERVVEYVQTVFGLTIEERVIYTPVIEICHNYYRYLRVTGKVPPLNLDQQTLALLNRLGTVESIPYQKGEAPGN